VCDKNLGVIEMGEHNWDVFELVIQRAELTLRRCLVPLFMMVPGVRYCKRISSLISSSAGVVMLGRWEAGEVDRILKYGSPCLSVARREARQPRVKFLLLLLRTSIFKLLSKVSLIDFSISCHRLEGGGGLLEDGTGVPLDGVGVLAVKDDGLNDMVGSENAC
jgi:hypothetical protein